MRIPLILLKHVARAYLNVLSGGLAGAVVGGLAGAGIAYVAQVRRKYGVTRGKFARLSNVSERTLMEWEKADPPDETRLRTIRELDRLHEALARVIDPEAIAPWLERPNDAFGGSTPLQVIERGESDRLWRMVFFLETGATF